MIPDTTTKTEANQAAFDNEVNSAKDALLADNDAEIAEASPVHE
jgi:hypothetical protein